MSRNTPLSVSLNGADNVGKTTHLRWLAKGLTGSSLMGTVDHWEPRWQRLAAGDFAAWWFRDSTTREHVDLVLTSHAARRAASGPLALEDRGRPMLIALCAATAAVKHEIAPEEALTLVDELAEPHEAVAREEIHVLLRHAEEPGEEAELALAREERPVSRWYGDYQRTLAVVLDIQAQRGDYDQLVVRGERPILPIQRELRDRLRARGLAVGPLPPPLPARLWVLGGMSESGKSMVSALLRAEHGTSRLKIGYLLGVAAARAGIDDPYRQWEECEQAEALTEEVLRFGLANNEHGQICLESAHRFVATQHLKRIWGNRCQVVYVEADLATRTARSREDPESIRARDEIKTARGAPRIASIADVRLDNSGSLAALKLAVEALSAASMPRKTLPRPVAGDTATVPQLRHWLSQATRELIDPEVAAVLATGSTGQRWWRPGWSDLDLLVIRDRLPTSWITATAGSLRGPGDTKLALSLFTTAEVAAGRVPPRVIHALRLAGHSGHGVLYLRDGFAFPDPGHDAEERTSRAELTVVIMMLRRLLIADPLDVRAVHKHVTLLMKILLRADGNHAEPADEVLAAFRRAYPAVPIELPSTEELSDRKRRKDRDIAGRVLTAAETALRYHDSLVQGATAMTRTAG